jgi:hypothetical protein
VIALEVPDDLLGANPRGCSNRHGLAVRPLYSVVTAFAFPQVRSNVRAPVGLSPVMRRRQALGHRSPALEDAKVLPAPRVVA